MSQKIKALDLLESVIPSRYLTSDIWELLSMVLELD